MHHHPISISIVHEKTGYPTDRIIVVKSIEVATRFYKTMGAKHCNFLVTDYIFVSADVFDKMTDQEVAAVVVREAGAWKMWLYTRSYLKLAFQFLRHGLLGYVVIKSYGSKTLEQIFQLEPGMHPMVTEWIIWGLLRHPVRSVYGLIAGSLEAIGQFHLDDFVSDILQPSAFFDAVVNEIEFDLRGSSIYDSWYSRRFIGEPTVWERLDRMTRRYLPRHRSPSLGNNQIAI